MAIDKRQVNPHLRLMLHAFSLTLTQLGDRAFLRVLVKSLGLTLLIFAVLGVALVMAVQWISQRQGWGEDGGFAAATAATLAAFAGAWLLFRAVAIPVISIFADEIVAAVEARHYPEAANTAQRVTVALSLAMAAASLARMIGFNLLAIPAYIVLIVTGVGPLVLFFAINALLLGRDLGEMVAARHLDRAGIKVWLAETRGKRAVMGAFASTMFFIPFLNLLAPIMGAGMATHLFHARQS